MELPEVLSQVRAAAGISLAELARRVEQMSGKISKQGMSHYETGERQPDPTRIKAIAAACSVSISVDRSGWTWKPKKGGRK
jgi:transcriptional regulator with XRE-family HTH domain